MALDTTIGGEHTRAYASVTDLDSYVVDYGRSLVDASGNQVTDTAAKESALRQGALLLGFYATRWPGKRASETQAMDWPRENATYRDKTAIGSGVIPREVIDANCEAAIHALQSPEEVRSVISGQRIRKVDGSAASVEFFETTSENATVAPRSTFTTIDDLLSRLLVDTSTTSTGSGAATLGGGFLLAGKAD